jgi:hypothetical protein
MRARFVTLGHVPAEDLILTLQELHSRISTLLVRL